MVAQNPTVRCHPVAEAHWFMECFAFAERRGMELLAAWVWTTGDLDAKLEFGRHAYEDATHAELFLQRSTELRSALPTYGWQPRMLDLDTLDQVFRALIHAPTLASKLGALYGALKPWTLRQYEAYVREGDPIMEGPTLRLLEQIMVDERRHIAWGQAFLDALVATDLTAQREAEEWRARVTGLLAAPAAPLVPAGSPSDPLVRFVGVQPASDPRMHLVYYTPGKGPSEEVDFDPQSETEIQQVMLSTLVSVETEAEELLCRILVEYPDLPWTMRLQLARQMWDECRHAASQRRILEGLGASLGTWPAITYINRFVGDEPDVLKRLIVLQRVVEGTSVDQHRPRGRFFLEQGMIALVTMFDYVLADEDGHIALSRWIPVVAGDDPARLHTLAAYQVRKEGEFSDFLDWLVSKRRDLQRLYQPAGAVSAR